MARVAKRCRSDSTWQARLLDPEDNKKLQYACREMDEFTYPTADPLCEQVREVACMVDMRRAAHFVYAQVLEWLAGKTDAEIQAHRKRTL